MESNNNHNIDKRNFDAFVHAVGSEIEQAQVRLITAANAQMLFHYWKWAIIYCTSKTCMAGVVKLSRSWHRQSGSTILKRKDIRSVILLICASLPVYIR